jgi:transcriptional regulator with XRE-family HTH domain
MTGHWTSRSTADFVHRISSDFVFQIENRMEEEPINQSNLAKRLGVSDGRVSQVLRNPGNITLKKMVEYAQALGMKVAIVAYDDGDPKNENGPINSQIFTASWKRLGRPNDFFAFHKCASMLQTTPPIRYISPLLILDEGQTGQTQLVGQLGWWEKRPSISSTMIESGVK